MRIRGPEVVTDMSERHEVDMWFDPLCPWAWLTSRWLLEVATVRPLDIRFHLMSLYTLNIDREISPEYRARIELGRNIGRVVMATAKEHGDEVLLPLYTALGRRLHNERREPDQETVAAALAEVGLPAELLTAWDSADLDALVEASHADGQNRVGLDVGTPIISVEGVSFFGPVVTPAPTGEAAGRLWDGVLLVASTPGFYELKRTRDERPNFEVGAVPLHSW
jgi:2-hydroxychromene-2-carboxylate isomerase